mmetsp:Transcript_38484/g.75579  ORF Transcript_38484/g.75579 Transcript_38484/m.75579 type:complete len:85 (+) Transcript_38484:256-510(+)
MGRNWNDDFREERGIPSFAGAMAWEREEGNPYCSSIRKLSGCGSIRKRGILHFTDQKSSQASLRCQCISLHLGLYHMMYHASSF